MADINRTLLMGRLGTDPIMRETQNGIKVTTLNLATEHWLKTKNTTETSWHKIVVWGKSAVRCFDELKKGMPVFVEGKLKSRKYENKDGETKYAYEVHADYVRFLHRKVDLKSSFVEQESDIEDSDATEASLPATSSQNWIS